MQICNYYYKRYKKDMHARLVVPESGYYLWITFDKSIRKYQVTWLVNYLKKQRVIVLNGAKFYPDGYDIPAIRICISNCTIEQLKVALKMIFLAVIEFESKLGR